MPTYGARSLWTSTVVVAYVGPGDIVSGADGWWGLRAYNNATIGNSVVRLRRDSDDAESTFPSIAGGGLNSSDIAAFAGAANLFVVRLFDQTGNGNDLIQVTTTKQPSFTLSGLGALPIMTFDGGDSLATAGSLVQNAPYSVSFVYNATNGVFGVIGGFVDHPVSCGVNFSGANQVYGSFGSTVTVTASNNAYHAIQEVANGASGDIVVDGTSNTNDIGSTNLNSHFILGALDTSPTLPFTGVVLEFGLWGGAFSAGNKTSMNSNQHSYWGF